MRNKKVLSFALVLALTVSLFPAAAFASDNTEAAAAAVEETAEQASSEMESDNEDISGQESVEEVNSDEDSSEEIAPEAEEITEEEADSNKDSENAENAAKAVSEEADETNADADVTDVTGDFEDEGAEAGTSDAEAADSDVSVEVNAEEAEVNTADMLANAAENADDQPAYVLMNIPYDEFYEAESGVADTISSATLRGKARNKNLCGASYHQSEEAVTTEGIAGATYPVYVAKLADLKSLGGLEITDDRVISYETNNHGQVSTVELKGKDSLQEAPNYSYYVLNEEPASYKTLTVTDGKASFSAASGNAETRSEITGQVTMGGRHTEVEIALQGVEVNRSDVAAAVVTAGDNKYAMHHVVNIWNTELGWNLSDLNLEAGTAITNVRYYLKDGSIIDYPAADITIGEMPSYVLMNIPYADFYGNEAGVVDTISSATLRGKARNVNINGASYHQSEEAVTTEGIAGVMYPVRVNDAADLQTLGGTQITDDSSLTYEMSARGQVTTVELKGKDALQEAPSYSYYVLSEKPAFYKTLTVTDGAASFSAASGRAAAGSEITGQVTLGGRHTYVEIVLDGLEVTPSDVSAVIVTAGENKYAMHHVVNIWRGTELGWDLGDIDLPADAVISNVRYFLKDGTITDYPAQIKMYAPGWNEVEGGKKYYDLSTRKFFNSEFAVIDGSTYYFDENEMMVTGWKKVDGEWYLLKSNGVMAANEWAKDSTGWCWMDASGKITKNKWIQSGGQWYFLKANGYMAANEWAKDSTGWCWMDASGKITKNQWIKSGGQWYFLKANGYMAANEWAKDNTGWCWMDASGKITKNKWIQSGGQWYFLKANGYMAANEWAKDSGGWYWMNASGKITKNQWIKSGGKWYYLGANGYMVTGTQKIGGKTYKFSSSGVWIK